MRGFFVLFCFLHMISLATKYNFIVGSIVILRNYYNENLHMRNNIQVSFFLNQFIENIYKFYHC